MTFQATPARLEERVGCGLRGLSLYRGIAKGQIRDCMGNGDSEQIRPPPPVIRVFITTTWVTCITRASLSDLPAF